MYGEGMGEGREIRYGPWMMMMKMELHNGI